MDIMRLRSIVPSLGLTVLLAACGTGENPAVPGGAAAPPSVVPDLDAIAANLVRSARVAEGDVVLIIGSVRDLELLENLVIEVQKLGGSPLLSIGSERVARRSFDEVPERYDTLPPQWMRISSSEADVIILVDQSETPDLLAHVPPSRIQARGRAVTPFNREALRRGVRTVEVGNGLYPTHARAARFGLTRDELAAYFWNGLAADPAMLLERGQQLRPILAASREVRVTHPNGTDVTFQLDTRDIFINDGAISEADQAAGGVNVLKYLPAGEIYARVRPGTGTGRVVADHYSFQGADIPGLTFELANGEITSISAPAGVEPLLAAYGTLRDGRERLTVFDIGLNPGVPATPGSRVLTFVPAGMVTLFFGNDSWAGGTNTPPFSISPYLSGATVTIDGRVIVENGALQL
jgi:aminopeptidase